MPHDVRPRQRGLLLAAVLAAAVAGPCAVFAVTPSAPQQTLIASRAAVPASPVEPILDRPRAPVAVGPVPARPRPVPTRASRSHRAVPRAKPVQPQVLAAAPMSGSLAARVLAEARRHAGAPYAYGAAGPNRFDCSGFTMYVFGRFGISLPHSSSAQASVARRIPDGQKRPGDLIFTYHGGTIGHVGIYAGGSSMWAAVESGDVVRLQSFAGRTYRVGRVG